MKRLSRFTVSVALTVCGLVGLSAAKTPFNGLDLSSGNLYQLDWH